MMKEKIKKFLTEKTCLKISCIEREAEIPAKSLEHFLSGRRGFKDSHVDKVVPVLKQYGFTEE